NRAAGPSQVEQPPSGHPVRAREEFPVLPRSLRTHEPGHACRDDLAAKSRRAGAPTVLVRSPCAKPTTEPPPLRLASEDARCSIRVLVDTVRVAARDLLHASACRATTRFRSTSHRRRTSTVCSCCCGSASVSSSAGSVSPPAGWCVCCSAHYP